MKLIRQQVTVTFHYPVHFTTDLFDVGNPLLAQVLLENIRETPAKRVLVVVDEGVAQHHPALLQATETYLGCHEGLQLVTPPLVVVGGERAKNTPENVYTVQQAVHTYGIDRHAYILAVGGGAVLDMVGYAAATSHRGVRLVRIPTTVLSQNDSAVGVKNGINAFGKKNFLGTFAPPYAVLNDATFLETLEERDWRGGLSEAVKVALLKDAEFFDFLERSAGKLRNRDAEAMSHAVYRCAELHLNHIATSGDPFEFGSSRPLDFGHWAAHKLEALTHYDLRHGEAVAVGIALDSVYSHLAGMLAEGDLRRILDVFASLGLETFVPELDDPAVLAGMNEFREHLGGRLTIMLLEGIGQGKEVYEMDDALVREAIAQLKEGTWHTPQTSREAVH